MGKTFKPEEYKWNGQEIKLGGDPETNNHCVEKVWHGITWAELQAIVLKASLNGRRRILVKRDAWHIPMRPDSKNYYSLVIEEYERGILEVVHSFYALVDW